MRRISLAIVLASLTLAACGHKGGSASGTTDATGTAGATGTGAAPAAPQPATTLTVTVKAPAVGDKREAKDTSEMDLVLSIALGKKPKEVKLLMQESTVKTEEVLAVDGKAITKAKVTYTEKKKTETEDGKEKKRPKSPIEGKSYVVELKNGKVVITDEKGKKPSKREEDAVRKDNEHFGVADPILAAMPDKPLEVGKTVDALSAALQEFLMRHDDSKDKPEVNGVEVKLASIEGTGPDAVGVFSVALTMATPPKSKNPFEIKAPLTGTMKVRAKDGWTTSMNLGGPIELGDPDAKKTITGKGTLKLGFESTY